MVAIMAQIQNCKIMEGSEIKPGIKVKIQILLRKNELYLSIMDMGLEVMNPSLSILQPQIFNRVKRINISILRLSLLKASWTPQKWFKKQKTKLKTNLELKK
jgi:hypothetical protein